MSATFADVLDQVTADARDWLARGLTTDEARRFLLDTYRPLVEGATTHQVIVEGLDARGLAADAMARIDARLDEVLGPASA